MDSTDAHYLERELDSLVRQDSRLFTFMHERGLDGIWCHDLEQPDQQWHSAAFWRLLGYDPASRRHVAAEHQAVLYPDDRAPAEQHLAEHCADPDRLYDHIHRYCHRDGTILLIRSQGITIRDEQGRPIRVVGLHTDVTGRQARSEAVLDPNLLALHSEMQEANQRILGQARELERLNRSLLTMAVTDSLTGLHNRRAFDTQLRRLLKSALRHHFPLSLLIVDIDHFKRINDGHGHLAGDVVLKTVGSLLTRIARETDLVARWGGEEFTVLQPHTDADASLALGERIRHAVEICEWPSMDVTVSIGASTLTPPLGRADPVQVHDQLVREADTALYRVKNNGRNSVTHFLATQPN